MNPSESLQRLYDLLDARAESWRNAAETGDFPDADMDAAKCQIADELFNALKQWMES